ncbi:GNAT family N-acetyltransferase [Cellvibrio sp. KY-GH-1]|uniref:GNAT family N-acetyltransferase n=1 Tax=Cellvibrio sp. KY-GH-1 TaxID=2303332 RepID=UPI001CD91A9B|nr:GNAT family N-acetyltransferase [Cellvibrio sp. KY-GH-1]
MGKITAPGLLASTHELGNFNSGNSTLDEWLIRRALKNQESGASRTFVICEDGSRVIGYYALATGSIERISAAGSFSRGMPDPIPVIILGRLAVDIKFQGKRLGAALLKDAMLRTLAIASNVGVRGLLVHAISEQAKQFYLQYGFQKSPTDPMTLLLSLKNISQHL